MVLFNELARDGIEFHPRPGAIGADEGCLQGSTVGIDRGEALEELLTAWGAVLIPYEGVCGQVPAPSGPITRKPWLEISAGDEGTLVDAQIVAERSRFSTMWWLR